MKEFQSTTGGRHVYNSDFKNLQELALAMQELFRACGGNFVISGCDVTAGDTISVTSGYVYINGKIRAVAAASGLSASNLCIIENERNGDIIPYADGSSDHNQYIEYYAETKNVISSNKSYIAYDSKTGTFPNLATVFFNYYAVCKKAGSQSIDSLTVNKSLVAANDVYAKQGITLDNASTRIAYEGNAIVFSIGNYSLSFNNNGTISVKQEGDILFSFSNGSGSGTVTYENINVTQNLRTNKLYIDGIDIENKIVPFGVIQMWAGTPEKVPDNYVLCDGRALNQKDYPELYSVIGTTFNTGINTDGNPWTAPSSDMFRVPDLRGRFIVGYSPATKGYETIGNAGGENTHALKIDELPSHTHSVDDYYLLESAQAISDRSDKIYGKSKSIDSKAPGTGSIDDDNDTMVYYTHNTAETGSGSPHENRPPYYVLAYIMRVK